ncbi:DEAD/DEAH box helicase family protein [Sedimentibacter sp. zth1]|uniref:DEAD/DEAH box helicase family protein n=1 Tax=Sedimentibacter sp. zth1 TaxID=2816908 RepID=UPI001A91B455|nr:DEAD/DEAH box helicase family protein [Sedimentibacter sp. zth1]QSX04807.1 DEAD/DEAH box helicase family protein [Sedimentibacter sp. zth1]
MELTKEVTLFSFNLNAKKKEIGGKYICEELKTEIKKWNSKIPVYISTQTGTGKTTFILNDLLKFCITNNKSMLLLVNRQALKTSIMKDIKKAKIPNKNKVIKYLPDSKLHLISDISPNIKISTYQQQICDLVCKKDLCTPYDFIVMDEAHFFYSDSLFNSRTEYLLKKLITNNYNAVRIYISATPEISFDLIHSYETIKAETELSCKNIRLDKMSTNAITYNNIAEFYNKILLDIFNINDYCKTCCEYFSYKEHCHEKETCEKCRFNPHNREYSDVPFLPYLLYTRPRNYDYLNPYSFGDKNELIKIVKTVIEKGKRFLIFVDSKAIGNELKDALGSNAVFIDSQSKFEGNEGNCEYKEITENKTFSSKVLITTAVMDNGISIDDYTTSDIAIFSTDIITTIQFIGRVRVTEKSKVNIYIHDYSKDELNKKLNYYYELYKLIDTHKKKKCDIDYLYDYANIELLRNLFYHDNNKSYINNIAAKKTSIDITFLKNLVLIKNSSDENIYAHYLLDAMCISGDKLQQIETEDQKMIKINEILAREESAEIPNENLNSILDSFIKILGPMSKKRKDRPIAYIESYINKYSDKISYSYKKIKDGRKETGIKFIKKITD